MCFCVEFMVSYRVISIIQRGLQFTCCNAFQPIYEELGLLGIWSILGMFLQA